MDHHDEEHECCQHDLLELIDEGHQLIGEGRLAEAQEVLKHAAGHDPAHPEVVTLDGCIHSAEGRYQEAVRLFERATEIDPTYFMAYLDMAELQLDRLTQPDRCLHSCNRALDLTRDDEIGRFEALMFRAAALVDLHRDDEAAATLRQTKGLPVDDPALLERVGRLWLVLGDWRSAEAALRAALTIDEQHADSWHSLGAVYEARGQTKDMVAAWLRVLDLDEAAPPSPFAMRDEDFEEVVSQAFLELPEPMQVRLEQVAILVEPLPGEEDVQDGLDPRLLGLFYGPPLDQQGVLDAALVEPNCIKLYQRNLEAAAHNPEHLLDEVRTTLLHETAHFFGLEDDDLDAMGLG